MKEEWYSRPHETQLSWYFNALATSSNNQTQVPLIMYDEGLGAPSGYKAHRENASFAAYDGPNCYPDSRINSAYIELELMLTKHALEVDKLHHIKLVYMPIFTSFEDTKVIDELSATEIQDVLKLQTESTDRQSYPLWTAINQTAVFTGSNLLGADVPGLAVDQQLECCIFDMDDYYDALQYLTISEKLKACSGGLRQVILTKDNPYRKIRIQLPTKSKKMVPYNQLSLYVGIPRNDGYHQTYAVGDVTSGNHVRANLKVRFHEWNQGFYMEKL